MPALRKGRGGRLGEPSLPLARDAGQQDRPLTDATKHAYTARRGAQAVEIPPILQLVEFQHEARPETGALPVFQAEDSIFHAEDRVFRVEWRAFALE